MNNFKLFENHKPHYQGKRSSFHFSPIKVQNLTGDASSFSVATKKGNRLDITLTAAQSRERGESKEERHSHSATKPSKIFRILKKAPTVSFKALDPFHSRRIPRWDNITEPSEMGLANSASRASPESSIRNKATNEVIRTKTCPLIVNEGPLKVMKFALTSMEDAITMAIPEKDPDYFIYTVGKGNNDMMIRRVMQKRYWFREGLSSSGIFHFTWQPTSKGIHYDKLYTNKGVRQIVNHYEFHHEISTKIGLIKNLQKYCEKANLDLFDLTPTTYILDLEDTSFASEFQQFVAFFQKYSKLPADHNSQLANTFPFLAMKFQKLNPANMTVSTHSRFSQPKMQPTLYNGCNLWLLKPADYNRGRGINLFNKLASLEYYLKCFQIGESNIKLKSFYGQLKKTKETSISLVKSNKFVIQKYLEKPLLIDSRKFDIRVWVLLDQHMNLYYFREGYIRLSSEVFTLNENQIEDKYVHLTNNAIQKDGKNYGKHESGNIISLHQLKAYLPKDKAKQEYIRILERIKELIRITMKSGREKLNEKERKYCFEIFGFDFILDQSLHVWLIEVNTNPCIEESNELLKKLVPRMLDDAFKLTIDKVIMPTTKNFKAEDARKAEAYPPFSVGGYDNDENIWEHLANLRGVQIFCKLK